MTQVVLIRIFLKSKFEIDTLEVKSALNQHLIKYLLSQLPRIKLLRIPIRPSLELYKSPFGMRAWLPRAKDIHRRTMPRADRVMTQISALPSFLSPHGCCFQGMGRV